MSMQVEKMTNELFSKREEISGMLRGSFFPNHIFVEDPRA